MTDYYMDPCVYCGTFCESNPDGCPKKRLPLAEKRMSRVEVLEGMIAANKAGEVDIRITLHDLMSLMLSDEIHAQLYVQGLTQEK